MKIVLIVPDCLRDNLVDLVTIFTSALTDPGGLWLTQADSYQLWQTLADSGRIWLTLADSWWLWLTLADSNRLWRTARVSQFQQESSKVIQSRSESTGVSQNLPESARVFVPYWLFGAPGGPQNPFFVENFCQINTLAAKLSNETYVHYNGNILEPVTKVTQTITKYDQF